MIFFNSRAGNASQSLRRLLAPTLVTWVKDFFSPLLSLLILSSVFFWILGARHGGRGGGIFDILALEGEGDGWLLGWEPVRVVLISGVFANLFAMCCLNEVPFLVVHLS